METVTVCPDCHTPAHAQDLFCAHCGKKLKGGIAFLSSGKIIAIYLTSFFIPPSGLYFGFKYAKASEEKIRKVGQIAIIITIVSSILTVITVILSIQVAVDIYNLTKGDLFPYNLNNLGL